MKIQLSQKHNPLSFDVALHPYQQAVLESLMAPAHITLNVPLTKLVMLTFDCNGRPLSRIEFGYN